MLQGRKMLVGDPVNAPKKPFYKRLWFKILELTIMLLLLSLSIIFVLHVNTSVPTPRETSFNATEALKVIREISKNSHSLNTLDNMRVFDYLLRRVESLKASSLHEIEIIVHRDDLIYDHNGYNRIIDVRNLLVFLKGKRKECMLISAHYDTKNLTFGTFDNTVGVAIALQVLESLAKMNIELEYSLLINFNNGEELGLLGAQTFVASKYAALVKGFINLGI